MPALLEHTNFTVSDPNATAAWMCDLFDWHIRWTGESINDGKSIHVGTQTQYLALYARTSPSPNPRTNYDTVGGLNHIAVVVDDIASMRRRVEAAGFAAGDHYDYEPGQRFYFYDHDGIEYEVVQYD